MAFTRFSQMIQTTGFGFGSSGDSNADGSVPLALLRRQFDHMGRSFAVNLPKALLANLTLPSDAELFAFVAFILAVILSLVGFCVGLKLQLGPRRRAGLW